MRKVILHMMVSADGYIEDTNRDISWHVWNEEMDAYMLGFFKRVDTFFYGRKSYELMIDYWPSQTGEFADIMNETPKFVFSRTLNDADWNAALIKENIQDKISNLKQEPGKDMALFAGADIASTFIKHNLIDEYRMVVNPIVLGEGTPLFKNVESPLNLKRVRTKNFECGNTLLCYEPAK